MSSRVRPYSVSNLQFLANFFWRSAVNILNRRSLPWSCQNCFSETFWHFTSPELWPRMTEWEINPLRTIKGSVICKISEAAHKRISNIGNLFCLCTQSCACLHTSLMELRALQGHSSDKTAWMLILFPLEFLFVQESFVWTEKKLCFALRKTAVCASLTEIWPTLLRLQRQKKKYGKEGDNVDPLDWMRFKQETSKIVPSLFYWFGRKQENKWHLEFSRQFLFPPFFWTELFWWLQLFLCVSDSLTSLSKRKCQGKPLRKINGGLSVDFLEKLKT